MLINFFRRNRRGGRNQKPEKVVSFGEVIGKLRASRIATIIFVLLIVLFVELPLKAQAFFDKQPVFFWLASLLSGLLFLLLAYWAAQGTTLLDRSSLERVSSAWLPVLVIGIGVAGWLLAADAILSALVPSLYAGYAAHPEFFRAWLLVAAVPGVGLLLPVGEEVLFRGLLQPHFAARTSPWLGILIAALLYGVRALDPLLFFSNLGVGLILGWAADRFNLPAAVGAHIVANLVLLAVGFILF